MFYLILMSHVLIPEKYPTLEDCKAAGEYFYTQKSIPNSYYCVPAPNVDKRCSVAGSVVICN